MTKSTQLLTLQYKLLSNFIKSSSYADFNVLIVNISDNIKSLILSESIKVEFPVDVDDVYSKILLFLWEKLPVYSLPTNELKGVNSFFSYVKKVAFNFIRRQRDRFFKTQKRNLYIDTFKDNCFEIKDEQSEYFNLEEEINFLRNQLQESRKEDFDILVDFSYNKYPLEYICKKYNISNPKIIYLKNNKMRKVLREKQIKRA